MSTFEDEFRKVLASYADTYDVDALNAPNDIANLHTMIRNQVVIQEVQRKIHQLAEDDAIENILTIQKLNVAYRDLSENNLALERALGIDRKTRQSKSETSVATYIASLKAYARDFIDQHMIRAYCPKCKVLVGRISPAHEHTSFTCEFQCSQCKKRITATRKERDVFFDIKDAKWRKEYPVEIKHPKESIGIDTTSVEDDIVLGDAHAIDG